MADSRTPYANRSALKCITSVCDRLQRRTSDSKCGVVANAATLGDVARLSSDEALQRLDSSANGLTMAEAGRRLRLVGPE